LVIVVIAQPNETIEHQQLPSTVLVLVLILVLILVLQRHAGTVTKLLSVYQYWYHQYRTVQSKGFGLAGGNLRVRVRVLARVRTRTRTGTSRVRVVIPFHGTPKEEVNQSKQSKSNQSKSNQSTHPPRRDRGRKDPNTIAAPRQYGTKPKQERFHDETLSIVSDWQIVLILILLVSTYLEHTHTHFQHTHTHTHTHKHTNYNHGQAKEERKGTRNGSLQEGPQEGDKARISNPLPRRPRKQGGSPEGQGSDRGDLDEDERVVRSQFPVEPSSADGGVPGDL